MANVKTSAKTAKAAKASEAAPVKRGHKAATVVKAAPAKGRKAAPKAAPKAKSVPVDKNGKPLSAAAIAKAKEKEKIKTAKTKMEKLKVELVTQAFTKKTLIEKLADMAGLEVKEARRMMLSLEKLMLGSLMEGGHGSFIMPGLFKIVAKKVDAKPAREGRNPATGETMMFAAKPATIKVKIRPLNTIKLAAIA